MRASGAYTRSSSRGRHYPLPWVRMSEGVDMLTARLTRNSTNASLVPRAASVRASGTADSAAPPRQSSATSSSSSATHVPCALYAPVGSWRLLSATDTYKCQKELIPKARGLRTLERLEDFPIVWVVHLSPIRGAQAHALIKVAKRS